jgi:hypothetical protein
MVISPMWPKKIAVNERAGFNMKEFNITGLCVPEQHYMVDIHAKIDAIIQLIEKQKYFTMNRARQYGKTTTLNRLYHALKDRYLVLELSFEGIGDVAFSSENQFCDTFIHMIAKRLRFQAVPADIIAKWEENKRHVEKFEELSDKISHLVKSVDKEVILMIDEVDKSGSNQLFLHFIGMLRNKYLDRDKGLDSTFKSVILAGVYDVKNLKLKLQPGDERRYNSPWNIATNFQVDMSFQPREIASMLREYEQDAKTGMDIAELSQRLYDYTRGYPFLVSRLCKAIDEELNRNWTALGLESAVKILLDEKNTLFDDLIKNIENNSELYRVIYDILLEGKRLSFNIHNPIIDLGVVLGIFTKNEGILAVSNRVFELCIYDYMISKRSTSQGELLTYEYRLPFVVANKLNMELVLNKFQEVMHDEFRDKDARFIEREGRLLFLCFLKPIINGIGFYYVEPETRLDNRMDLVVTYGGEQHIVELKIWHGENYEQEALEQLAGYLESKREKKGYLISFSFNKNKAYTKEWQRQKDKDIYAIVV